ncbi:hypothetical protein DXG01_013995 [Tephrocybe rancida]|nr:hypothetical protein DXG01_013995 [Tephrocybe rancida]
MLKWLKRKFPPKRKKLYIKKYSSSAADVARTSLLALKESSDAFPPLKSVTCAVSALWDISDRVKFLKEQTRELTIRCIKVLEDLADCVPDPASIPPDILSRIKQFEQLVMEIIEVIKPLQKRSSMAWLLHLNREEGVLRTMSQRLDEARQQFIFTSSIRVETKLSHTEEKIISSMSQTSHQLVMQWASYVLANAAGMNRGARAPPGST